MGCSSQCDVRREVLKIPLEAFAEPRVETFDTMRESDIPAIISELKFAGKSKTMPYDEVMGFLPCVGMVGE